ncbi:MAG TPA: glycosyltransferase family 39 protein [Alphaproteobacteria bacterium]
MIGEHRIAATAAGLLIVVAALLAWQLRFVQDDAFILFRYAQNLVDGRGLVWNPGEYVQGYTSLAWVLIVAAGLWAGFEPVAWSQAVSLCAGTATMAVSYALFRRFLAPTPALAALTILATNYTFLAYFSGGLETQAQALFVALGALVALRYAGAPTAAWGVAVSVVWGLALLTRLDSAIFAAVFGTYALWHARGWRDAAALLLPGAAMLAGQLGWAWFYYGEPLPNTFEVKATHFSIGRALLGLRFAALFTQAYLILWVAAFAVLRLRSLPGSGRAMAAAALLWVVYIVYLGGGFMEFRLFVPVMPFLAVLAVVALGHSRWLLAAAVAVFTVASTLHAATFAYRQGHGIDSVPALNSYVRGRGVNWTGVGQALGSVFPPATEKPTIATTAAGAIPFYSGLPTIDQYGLNDRWIARNAPQVGARPGHGRPAPLAYLERRGVNLVLGHPRLMRADALAIEHTPQWFHVFPDEESRPRTEAVVARAPVVLLPVGEGYVLPMLYLTPHPAVARAIAEGRIHVARPGN